jgi:hypothetical protein
MSAFCTDLNNYLGTHLPNSSEMQETLDLINEISALDTNKINNKTDKLKKHSPLNHAKQIDTDLVKNILKNKRERTFTLLGDIDNKTIFEHLKKDLSSQRDIILSGCFKKYAKFITKEMDVKNPDGRVMYILLYKINIVPKMAIKMYSNKFELCNQYIISIAPDNTINLYYDCNTLDTEYNVPFCQEYERIKTLNTYILKNCKNEQLTTHTFYNIIGNLHMNKFISHFDKDYDDTFNLEKNDLNITTEFDPNKNLTFELRNFKGKLILRKHLTYVAIHVLLNNKEIFKQSNYEHDKKFLEFLQALHNFEGFDE